ncbi:hypothetical protein G4P69_38945, partial [Aetokthonos hydrillicola CCALA 1050]|nr:hypothetical protein [Aetokthonos hydrillicola CCALA 1050]
EGFYPEPFQRHELPLSLEAYYQQHWQKMTGGGLSDIALKVLRVLTSGEETQGISGQASGQSVTSRAIALAQPLRQEKRSGETPIAQTINEDEYDVEEVLENWLEFLQRQQIGTEKHYSFYHSSFQAWLAKQISNL